MSLTGKQLAKAAVNQILKHPQTWDQREWHSDCGTKHCFAGWCQILSGKEPNRNSVEEDAREALKINCFESAKLFCANTTIAELYQFARYHDFTKTESYRRAGYDSEGYDSAGYDYAGYDRDGYDRDGYDREGYNQDGYDRGGYDREGYNQDGYDRGGYDRDGYDVKGWSCEGYNRAGYNSEGYDRAGYSSEGFNRQGYDRAGYARDGKKLEMPLFEL